MEPKTDFWELFLRCFFRLRFGIDFGSVLGGSKPEKHQFSLRKTRIFTKLTFTKKVRKTIDVGSVSGDRNDEKSTKSGLEKDVFFEHWFLHVFFRILAILARFWEAQAPPKIAKKLKKSQKNRFWSILGVPWSNWEGLGRDFGAIWSYFGWIFEEFWKDFWIFWLDVSLIFGNFQRALGNRYIHD